MLLCLSASSWQAAQARAPYLPADRAPLLPARRRALSPLLREVDVSDLPLRPPMCPATLVNRVADEAMAAAAAAVAGAVALEEEQEEETSQQSKARVKAKMDTALIGDASSTVVVERLKAAEDQNGGVSQLLGRFLLLLDPPGIVRRRLWTRADFMHIHAVSGAYFLFLGIPWLFYSHIVNAMDISVPMETSSWFLTSLMLSGLVNALSAVPMSRFTSNKIMDVKDLKANGFTFGGTGLTCMCLYIAYWFSGDYPDFLRPFDIPMFLFWALVCLGTSVNWEVMLQQNFEANERTTGKLSKLSKDEMNKKAILYRVASWPNLTQLMFMYSIPFGGSAWLRAVQEQWPMQNTPMCDELPPPPPPPPPPRGLHAGSTLTLGAPRLLPTGTTTASPLPWGTRSRCSQRRCATADS